MKKRSESLFGIHCDFHAKPSKADTIGATLREEDIRSICRELKPDFIQIDCKGHPGWASYPSKLGNAMPNFVGDPLATWRRVTREEGVALYMHYSGVYDIKYSSEHPEECAVFADGSLNIGTTRLMGKYADELLIPQICELAERYEIDGVWIDGECWRASTDFSPDSVKAFEKATNIDLRGRLPATPEDEYYQEYREYHRELFRQQLRHYVDTLHERFPHLQIASNWAFSDHMPEKVSANVDYLSGDFNPKSSFNSARYAGRALVRQNRPWDLMSWNFRIAIGDREACVTKHKTQTLQEAAEVLALGGAYQNYVMQNNDGSPQLHELLKLTELAEFVRKRKDFCFRGRVIPEAALLLSTYDRAMESKRLYSRTGYLKTLGMSSLMCDIGLSFEIISEHILYENSSDYKMIVVPELFSGLKKETVTTLLEYAEKGGRLVLAGKKTCKIFSENGAPFKITELPERFEAGKLAYDNGGDIGHDTVNSLPFRSYAFTMDNKNYGALFTPVSVRADNAETVAYVSDDPTTPKNPLAVTVSYGKGSITALGFDIGSQYDSGRQYLHRTLMKSIAHSLYVPMVKVEDALGILEIVCLEKNGRLMVQLINGNGHHADPSSITEDTIPPVLDIRLSIALDSKPSKLILQPEGRELDFEYSNGRAYVDIGRLDIHSVIEAVQ